MTQPNNTPIIKPKTVAPPSVSNLSVAQVGAGMFSVAMQVIIVDHFPTGVPTEGKLLDVSDIARSVGCKIAVKGIGLERKDARPLLLRERLNNWQLI